MHAETIPTIDDLSPAWFDDLLRRQGALPHDIHVTSATLARFGDAESMMSALHRATLTYDGPTDAPTSLVVKLASASDRQRFIAGLFKFYEREVRFYRELSGEVTVRTPRCWLASMHPEEPLFVLVLEEVTGCRQVDQLHGVGFEDAATCVATLADLHAPFWGRDLSHLAETFVPMNAPAMHLVIPDSFGADWSVARDKVAHELPPEVVALCDRFGAVTSPVLDDMLGPDTLAHCDFRSDNLLFAPDGSVMVLDFQLAAICNGLVDVAYFISQSVREDVAAAHADALVDVYLDRLAHHGIHYDRQDAQRPYGAGLVFFLTIPMSLLAAGSDDIHARGPALARTMLRRASAEILRTGAHLRYV